jgi:hypothetical protein
VTVRYPANYSVTFNIGFVYEIISDIGGCWQSVAVCGTPMMVILLNNDSRYVYSKYIIPDVDLIRSPVTSL